MAERRMFSKKVVCCDAFLDMPVEAQCLYFQLGMVADDDGFINNTMSTARMCGFGKAEVSTLINNGFLIHFDSGVDVLRHWKLCNYIQSDRYKPTEFKAEKNSLRLENNIYMFDSS